MSIQNPVGLPPEEPAGGARSGVVAVVVLVVGVVGVFATAGLGLFYLSDWVSSRPDNSTTARPDAPTPAAEVTPQSPAYRTLISPPGLAALVEALREETGSTRVFRVVVYPDYAVLDVPETPGSSRSRSLYFDGVLRETGVGTSSDRAFNLARLPHRPLVALSDRIRRVVDEPVAWYLILSATNDEGAAVFAYANNEYGEGGYLAATPSGKVVRRVTW